MIESNNEDFTINNCPICACKHLLTVKVFRNILPNDINKDVRVPIINKYNAKVICPIKNEIFEKDIMLQEDIYSKITKITNK